MYERAGLQRLLRDDIKALGEDLLVIAEEFSNWEDARRRIDLLAIDKGGHLVVIELKRTDDGGHMDLQAIRYAAMVSSVGFAEVAAAYASHIAKQRPDESFDARAELLSFLDMDEETDEPAVSILRQCRTTSLRTIGRASRWATSPKADVLREPGGLVSPDQVDQPDPVYGEDLKTVVGHMYPGLGFVAEGTDLGSVPPLPTVPGSETRLVPSR